MKHTYERLASSVILIVFLASTTLSQDLDDSVIHGTVKDAIGGLVAGATVEAAPDAGGLVRLTITDRNGRFRLVELPPGTYSVNARAEGFSAGTIAGLRTASGQSIELNIVLAPSEVTAQVTVEISDPSDGPDISRTVVGSTLTTEETDELPNPTGDPLDLVFTLSGTDDEPFSIRDLADDDRIGSGSESDRPSEVIGAGNVSLAGGAAYSTNITIDGLDNNDDRSAEERFQPPTAAVAEVQVITNQFSSEYGRASGGRINIRTRAGTGKYRGRFFMFFEDESLNANTYNNNRRGLARLPYTVLEPGITVQGPVPGTNRRASFFSSYSFRDREASSMIDTVVPVDTNPAYPLPAPTHPEETRVDDIPNPQTDTFPAVDIAPYRTTVRTPGRNHRFTVRTDHVISDRHSITLNYHFGRSNDRRQYRETTRFLEETLQGRTRRNDAFYLTDNLVLGGGAVNQVRFQISDYRPGFAAGDADAPVVLVFMSDDSRAGSGDQVRGTVVVGNSTANFANLRRERRTQIQDTLTFLAGRHTFRVGSDVQMITSRNTDLADATGTFNFSRVYDFLANQPSRYRRNFGSTSVQRNTYFGVFIQDDIQVRPGLTANLGLRYERESILRDDNNVGPRIAFALAPTRDRKTVIRIGAGVFYNRVLLRTLDDYAFGTSTVRFDSEALSGPSNEARCLNQRVPGPNALTDKCRFLAALAGWFPEAPDGDELRRVLAELGITAGGFVNETRFSRFVEKGIRIPESYQFNAGIERALGSGLALEANFTINNAARLWRETNVNAFRPPAGFASLTGFLLSLGVIPLGGVDTRFVIGAAGDATGVVTVDGVRIVNLASTNGSEARGAPIGIAFSALEATLTRPYDPLLGQVEMVSSIGRSSYEGLSVTLSRGFGPVVARIKGSFRAVYTFSRARDDGFVDTSSAQRAGDFRSEFGRSSIDRRHKFRFSGTFALPGFLGGLVFSPVLRVESSRPFNLGIGGTDRNLDDVGNDRPNFSGVPGSIAYRGPEDPYPEATARNLSLAPIGTPGDLPRNAGRGPGLFVFDAAVSRTFTSIRGIKVRPQLIVTNVLNAKVFSFGSDYINLSDSGSAEFQRGFLVPGRTLRQRKIRIGIRIDL